MRAGLPSTSSVVLVVNAVCELPKRARVLFCSLAILDPRVGHTMDVLSPFIPVLCHSD